MTNVQTKIAGFQACVFALLIALFLCAPNAYADSRNSDVILGSTVETQGLKAADVPNIDAEYAILVAEDGTTYFERDIDVQTQIASVTKIMTAIVALEYGDLSETKITVSEKASKIGESSAMLKAGDELTLEQALRALMICSGNDAAQAIAESMGGQVKQALIDKGVKDVPDNDYDAFVFAMNYKAQELGMTNSLFDNPHGLDFEQYSGDMYSSADDVSKMSQEAMKNETFRNIVATDKDTITVNREGAQVEVPLESTDILLGNYNGACGIKTGYTEKAGECFAGACNRDGKMLYAIILKSSSETQRFRDAQTLFDWVYNHTINLSLSQTPETVEYEQAGQTYSTPVFANVAHKGWIDKTFKASLSDPNTSINVFTLDGNVSQKVTYDDITADIHRGQKVGTVTFMQHNKELCTQDLVAAEDCRGPNFFEGIGIWWDRLFRGFSGEPTEATSYEVNQMPIIYGADASLDVTS